MSEQDGRQATTIQCPTTHDPEAWKAYWKTKGQPWRTEPEIDAERQKYLAELRDTVTKVELGVYPFQDIKLSRADVEWLLAVHENDYGIIDRDNLDPQGRRRGIRLEKVILTNEDLKGLPLVEARFLRAKLEGSNFRDTNLSRAYFRGGYLKGAILTDAHLEMVDFSEAHLEAANLSGAHLQSADLNNAHLEEARLIETHLVGANLTNAHLERADLVKADLQGAKLRRADLKASYLYDTHLEKADLSYAHLERAYLHAAHLQEANLNNAHLEGVDLSNAHLEGGNLQAAFFTSATNLEGINLGNEKFGFVSLAGVHWGDVDLSTINWSQMKILGDEYRIYHPKFEDGTVEEKQRLINGHQISVRAYRQLAVVLRNQGLNEDAARFMYRAQLMQRKVFWYQRKFGQYLFSLFLDLLTGYGYKPLRSFITYAVVISVFAFLYFLLGPHLAWNEAIVISMTAFHGRGFFPEQFKPGDPQALVAAIEAFVGLLIEVTFIATLTQRLFGK